MSAAFRKPLRIFYAIVVEQMFDADFVAIELFEECLAHPNKKKYIKNLIEQDVNGMELSILQASGQFGRIHSIGLVTTLLIGSRYVCGIDDTAVYTQFL